MKNISIKRAILVGQLWVNGPILPLMLTPLFILILYLKNSEELKGPMSVSLLLILLAVFFFGFVLAWLWWSINVPKWRLWAYRRVSDKESLQKAAVLAGIAWPKNSIFENTEIKSNKHRALENKYEKEN